MDQADGSYRPLESDAEIDALAILAGQSFAVGTDKARLWLAGNRDRLRVWRRGDEVAGGLLLIPMGQFFGGRSVPMTGVAGVCVGPDARGRGGATFLMREALAEMRQGRVALSTLYPATLPLYRRVGYELAGGQYDLEVPVGSLAREPAALPVRAMTIDDRPRVEAAYLAHARLRPGWLDRGPYIWDRVRRREGEREVYGYVVGETEVEGYLAFTQRPRDEGGYDLLCRDLVAVTPGGAARLLSFFAGHRSIARVVKWRGSPDDPLLVSLPERGWKVALADSWMLRLVHVEEALAARGYSPAVEARLELEVADEVLPDNQGRLVLEVAGGRAEVRPGGSGALRVHVRALASLYAGFVGADRLAALGRLEGRPTDLATADAVFAGPPPSCPDFF
jgi:predicted acetyltransferase